MQARWQFGADDYFFLFNRRERGPEEPHPEHISALGVVVEEQEATHTETGTSVTLGGHPFRGAT